MKEDLFPKFVPVVGHLAGPVRLEAIKELALEPFLFGWVDVHLDADEQVGLGGQDLEELGGMAKVVERLLVEIFEGLSHESKGQSHQGVGLKEGTDVVRV